MYNADVTQGEVNFWCWIKYFSSLTYFAFFKGPSTCAQATEADIENISSAGETSEPGE